MSIPSIPITRIVPATCAYALVVASAGFGAVFAWKIGSQHSLALGVLTVMFAVALEGIKPIAVCSAFRPSSVGNFIASLIVGLVAIAYSLTSELSLVAMSKGDLAASRESVSEASQRAKEALGRAKTELEALPRTRPVAALEALARAGSKERCAVENGTGKWVCPTKTAIQTELGIARRRVELERVLASDVGMQTNTSVGSSDPGSASLVTYLGLLGIVVPVSVVAQWLNLIPVLALEVGSALALVIVPRKAPEAPKALATLPEPHQNHANQATLIPPLHGQILDHVRGSGGSVRTTERGLAARLGSSKPTIHRALQELANDGLLILRSSKQGGTVLRVA